MRTQPLTARQGEDPLDLRLISVFRQTARFGSFTEAAAHIGRSAASVSRSIARLEDEVGVRLFHRTTRHLQLTAEGEAYLAEIDAGLDRIEAAGELLQKSQEEAIGNVRILLPDTFCKNFAVPLMAGFLAEHPRLSLDVQVQEFGSDPIEGGYDVALQFESPRDNSYISRRLGTLQIILAASPDYIARHGVPQTVADLREHECINLGLTANHPLEWHLVSTKGNDAVRFKPQGRSFFSGQFDAGILAAVHGMGIMQMDVAAALPHLERGTLKVVLPDYEIMGAELHLLYPHRDHLPRKTRVVIDFLAQAAQGKLRPAWFDPAAFAA